MISSGYASRGPLTPTRRQCESGRISNCDVGDVRGQKNPAVITQVGSTGYGECNTGRDKVEGFRYGVSDLDTALFNEKASKGSLIPLRGKAPGRSCVGRDHARYGSLLVSEMANLPILTS